MIIFSIKSSAEILSECGVFEFKGKIKSNDSGFFLILNEKTKSEIKLELINPPKLKLLAYLNREAFLEGELTEIDGTKGKIDTFSKISYSPINSGEHFQNHSLFLKEKKVCKK
jgi:hypothetical protein